MRELNSRIVDCQEPFFREAIYNPMHHIWLRVMFDLRTSQNPACIRCALSGRHQSEEQALSSLPFRYCLDGVRM